MDFVGRLKFIYLSESDLRSNDEIDTDHSYVSLWSDSCTDKHIFGMQEHLGV